MTRIEGELLTSWYIQLYKCIHLVPLLLCVQQLSIMGKVFFNNKHWQEPFMLCIVHVSCLLQSTCAKGLWSWMVCRQPPIDNVFINKIILLWICSSEISKVIQPWPFSRHHVIDSLLCNFSCTIKYYFSFYVCTIEFAIEQKQMNKLFIWNYINFI